MSDAPHPHPPWAEELRRRYLRNEATQFILYGNVFDLVEHGGELVPVREYLSERLFAGSKDVLVVYNVSTGGKIARRKGDLGGVEELLVLRERGKFLPAMERVLKTTERVALIVEYAETVAPAADAALMSDEDRGAVVTLHRWSMAPEIEAADTPRRASGSARWRSWGSRPAWGAAPTGSRPAAPPRCPRPRSRAPSTSGAA